MTVYLLQLLLPDEYEVIAITSTFDNAVKAAMHYSKKVHDDHILEKELHPIERHERPVWFLDIHNDSASWDQEVDRYAIAECIVDDPYWFGKEEQEWTKSI